MDTLFSGNALKRIRSLGLPCISKQQTTRLGSSNNDIKMKKPVWINPFLVFAVFVLIPASALLAQTNTEAGDIIEPDGNAAEELAKASQNPVANMISLPLQNNTNFDFGP
jgi:hypothetical protein